MTLKNDGAWHLGGFCFGQADPGTSKAAEIRAHVEWAGSQALGATGPVMLAAFDAREQRWGAVKDAWGQTTCEEKLRSANMKRQLGKTHDQKSFNFRILAKEVQLFRLFSALFGFGFAQAAGQLRYPRPSDVGCTGLALRTPLVRRDGAGGPDSKAGCNDGGAEHVRGEHAFRLQQLSRCCRCPLDGGRPRRGRFLAAACRGRGAWMLHGPHCTCLSPLSQEGATSAVSGDVGSRRSRACHRQAMQPDC